MSSCSEVASCLSEGATVCILTSGTCPPCVYALSGGDFSCYSRDTSGACPFSGEYAECDKASTSTSSASSTPTTSNGDSSGDNNSDTPAPTPKTKAPAKTTATPTATTAPTTSTSEASSSTGSNTNSNQTPSTDATTPSTDTTSSGSSTDATSTPSATTVDQHQSTQTASSSSTNSSGAEKALTSNTATTSGSPAVVNLALIGGAVVLVVIVIAFVARRVVKKKKMYATQENTVSSHNSAWSDRTLGTGGASGGNLYSTYSYKDEAGKGISMLSDSQASSAYGPGYDQTTNSGSTPRSKADFSNYGGDSQYATESQYYNDYSVSTGPELVAGAAAGQQHQFANNTVPPSARGNNNFVNATAMANRESSIGSVRQHPLTVSQLIDTSIEEEDEQAYASRKPHPDHYQIAVPPVPQSSRKPQIFAASTASSMRSDYDIVDPITMRDVEARNTEMLAEDSRYPKFSFESSNASDVYDGSSSEDESDDERVRQGEHTI